MQLKSLLWRNPDNRSRFFARFLVERDENARWHFFHNHRASKNKRTITKPHCWILLKYIHWIAAQKSQVLFIRLSPTIPMILSPFIGANSTIIRSLPTGKLRSFPCQLGSGLTHFWTQLKRACVVMSPQPLRPTTEILCLLCSSVVATSKICCGRLRNSSRVESQGYFISWWPFFQINE